MLVEFSEDRLDAPRRLGMMISRIVLGEKSVEKKSSAHSEGETGGFYTFRNRAERIIPAPPTTKRQGNQME